MILIIGIHWLRTVTNRAAICPSWTATLSIGVGKCLNATKVGMFCQRLAEIWPISEELKKPCHTTRAKPLSFLQTNNINYDYSTFIPK